MWAWQAPLVLPSHLLGCNDERSQAREWSCLPQECVLRGVRAREKEREMMTWAGHSSPNMTTCRSSEAPPRLSTSISKHLSKKSLNVLESFSGFCSSGVPLVAMRYSAFKMKENTLGVEEHSPLSLSLYQLHVPSLPPILPPLPPLPPSLTLLCSPSGDSR